jgi:hypothetical protein
MQLATSQILEISRSCSAPTLVGVVLLDALLQPATAVLPWRAINRQNCSSSTLSSTHTQPGITGGRLYPAHHCAPDPSRCRMDLKRVDGLQNLMGMLDHAKHQYWSEHGVNDHHFHAVHEVPRPLPSSTIHYYCPFASGDCALQRASEREARAHFHHFCSSVPNAPASLSAEAKMVEFAKMDSSSLIAAALAPSADCTDLIPKANNSCSGPLSGTHDSVQSVSPART